MGAFRLRALNMLALCAVIVAGCGDKKTEPQPKKNPAEPAAADDRFTEVDKVALMEKHYVAAIDAHDMLIRGDLDKFRARLGTLSTHELPSNAPAEWAGPHKEMREAAQQAKAASTLVDAAKGMAQVVQTCGACHAANVKGPVYRRPKAPEGPELVAKMNKHQWATERLWEGVTGPWDEAWSRGSTALAKSTVFAEGEGDSALHALVSTMRSLGVEGKTLTTGPERAQLYGRLLATCGACHQQAGVKFQER